LTIRGDHVEGLVFQGVGQTDHPRGELPTTHSSPPDDEKGDFAFQVGGFLYLSSCPVRTPLDIVKRAMDLGVVLVCQDWKSTQ
jgi:hypothetical protein